MRCEKAVCPALGAPEGGRLGSRGAARSGGAHEAAPEGGARCVRRTGGLRSGPCRVRQPSTTPSPRRASARSASRPCRRGPVTGVRRGSQSVRTAMWPCPPHRARRTRGRARPFARGRGSCRRIPCPRRGELRATSRSGGGRRNAGRRTIVGFHMSVLRLAAFVRAGGRIVARTGVKTREMSQRRFAVCRSAKRRWLGAPPLAVELQQVVLGQTESADRRFRF